jgi:hypothetical protein
MSNPVHIGLTIVGLLAYLAISLLYHRRWDASIRAALGRRMGTTVRWSKVDGTTFMGEGDGPVAAWDAQSEGPLRRQVLEALAVRTTQVVVMVLLGAAPAVGLLLLQMALGFHPVLVLISALAVIAIFALYWVGTYRT